MNKYQGAAYAAAMIGAHRGDQRVDKWKLDPKYGWCGAAMSELAQNLRPARLPEHDKGDAPLLCDKRADRLWGTGTGWAAWCRPDARVTPGDGFTFHRPGGLHACMFMCLGGFSDLAQRAGVPLKTVLALRSTEVGGPPPPEARELFLRLAASDWFWGDSPELTLGALLGPGVRFVTWDGNGDRGVCALNERVAEQDNLPDGITSWLGAYRRALIIPTSGRVPGQAPPDPRTAGVPAAGPPDNPAGERMARRPLDGTSSGLRTPWKRACGCGGGSSHG